MSAFNITPDAPRRGTPVEILMEARDTQHTAALTWREAAQVLAHIEWLNAKTDVQMVVDAQVARVNARDAVNALQAVVAEVEKLDADLAATAPAQYSIGLLRGRLKTIREAATR